MRILLLTVALLGVFFFNKINAQCSITGSANICGNNTIQLVGSGTAAVSNAWTSSNTNVATISQTGVVSPIISGTTTITYTTTTGCQATKIITVQTLLPQLTNPLSKSICSGDNVNLPLSANTGASTSYTWTAINTSLVSGEATTNQTTNTINNVLTITSNVNQFVNYTVTPMINTCSGSPTTIQIIVKPKPIISIPNVTTCAGQPTSLTAYPDIEGGTYIWTNQQTTQVLNVTPTITTTLSVTYTAPNGCVGINTGTINVSSVPVISVNSITLCQNTSGTLTVNSSVTGGTYSWSTGQTTNQISVSPSSNTAYTVTYILGQCAPVSTTGNVTISNNIQVMTANYSICAGQSATISPTYSLSNPGVYNWSNGSTTSSITVTPSTTTNYTVSYSVPSCSSSTISTSTSNVNVNSLPIVSFTPTDTICSGQSITISPTVNPLGGIYTWSTGATTSTISLTPTTTTTYNLTYSFNGCSKSVSKVIVVKTTPTVTISPVNVCPGNSPTTVTATANPTNSNFLWSTGATTNTVSLNTQNETNYTVISNLLGCNSAPKTFSVTPNIILSSNINGASICSGINAPPITITPSHSGGIYLWNTGATTNTISPINAGSYTVVYDVPGCNSATKTIVITESTCDYSQNSCTNPNVLCTENLLIFPNSINKPSLGTIGCLSSTPNPTWFNLTITQPGNISLSISQATIAGTAIDVDYIVFGPLTSSQSICSNLPTSNTGTSIVGCSYSTGATETVTINNTQIGEIYSLLVVNFSNQAGNITINQTSGTGLTACTNTCDISDLTAIPTTCNSNNYTLNGVVTFQNPPPSGTLSITTSTGESQTFNAPFVSPLSYSIIGLTANGTNSTVTAVFSANTSCSASTNFTSPSPCVISCSIPSLTANPSACINNTFNLTGNVSFSNPPATGTLTVTNSCGGTQTFNAPFTSPISCFLSNLTANGAACNVIAIFSDNSTCTALTNYTAPVACVAPCSISNLTAIPTTCSNNAYSLNGAVTFQNPPTTGTLTVTSSSGEYQVFNAPFVSPLSYSLTGLTANGTNTTVSAEFSANTGCVASTNFTAPVPCYFPCTFQNINVTPSACSNNLYTLDGYVEFHNQPTTDSLMVVLSSGQTQTFYAPFFSPLTFSISDLPTNGLNVSVTISFSANSACSITTNYTSPQPCFYPCAIQNVTAIPSACNNNFYSLSGAITFQHPPSYGTLTVSNSCGSTLTFNAPFTNPINYQFSNLSTDGNSCTVTASFSAATCTNSATFTAPTACNLTSCGIQSLAVTPGNCVNNFFNLNGEIQFTNPPTTGILTISTGNSTITLNPPFNSPLNFTIPHLATDGLNSFVSAVFSDLNCQSTTSFTAPAPCNCALNTVEVVGPENACLGQTTTLSANVSISGGTYFWYPGGETTQSIDISPTEPFTYEVYYTLFNCPEIWNGLDVGVASPVDPYFNQVPDVCMGETVSPLPLVSINDIHGTWYPPLNSNQLTTYYFIPNQGACGNIGYMNVGVVPSPTFSVAQSQAICVGDNFSYISFSSSQPGTIFNWTNSNPSIGLSASGSGDIPDFQGLNQTQQTQTATISVIATYNGCSSLPQSFDLTVKPKPDASILQSNQNLCCGSSTSNILFSSTYNGTNFNWTNNNAAIGLPNSGQGEISSFIATNASTLDQTTTITVVPELNGCFGDAVSTLILVHPCLDVTTANIPNYCNGQTAQSIDFVSSVSGVQYSWINSNTSIGLPVNGNGNVPSFTTINTGTSAQTAIISVTPTLNGCEGDVYNVSVTVNPTPIITVNDLTICEGLSGTITANPSTTGGSYTWTPTGETTSSIVVSPTSNASYTVFYTLNGCSSDTLDATVDVIPQVDFTIIASGPTTINEGETVELSTSYLSASSYQWYLNGQFINGATASTYTATVAGNYTLEIVVGSCPSQSNGIQVNVTIDSDGDGVLDNTETADGTDPTNSCDFVLTNQTNVPSPTWNQGDCDADGISNQGEVTIGTNPLNSDTDGDGVMDGTEINDSTDPLNPCAFIPTSQTIPVSNSWNLSDCDSDGLSNGEENTEGTNPLNSDTDGDGVMDGTEVADGTNPLDYCSFVVANQTQTPTIAWQNVDCDFDGLPNQGEIDNGTNPQNPDTDGDGVKDGKEIDDQTSLTNPCSFILSSQTLVVNANWNALDCDSDGLTNQEEQILGTNPTNSDTDGDGVTDGTEFLNVTNPLLPCDLILANQTVLPSNSWNTLDCDNDSLSNEDEIAIGTDIFNPDSDGDNLSDGHEVLNGSNPLDPCDPDNTRQGCQIVTIEIDIPQIFTPNADGINETFEIPLILDYPNNTIKIFNRWGTEVYAKSPYQNEWNGKTTSNLVIGEGELPTGTYFYVLDLEGDGSKMYKGYIYLKR